jgi:Domain of unknown function (DUF4360)
MLAEYTYIHILRRLNRHFIRTPRTFNGKNQQTLINYHVAQKATFYPLLSTTTQNISRSDRDACCGRKSEYKIKISNMYLALFVTLLLRVSMIRGSPFSHDPQVAFPPGVEISLLKYNGTGCPDTKTAPNVTLGFPGVGYLNQHFTIFYSDFTAQGGASLEGQDCTVQLQVSHAGQGKWTYQPQDPHMEGSGTLVKTASTDVEVSAWFDTSAAPTSIVSSTVFRPVYTPIRNVVIFSFCVLRGRC